MSSKIVKKQLQQLREERATQVLGVKKPGVSGRRVARAAKRLAKEMEPKKEDSVSMNLAYLVKTKGPQGRAKDLMAQVMRAQGRGGRDPASNKGHAPEEAANMDFGDDFAFDDEGIPLDF